MGMTLDRTAGNPRPTSQFPRPTRRGGHAHATGHGLVALLGLLVGAQAWALADAVAELRDVPVAPAAVALLAVLAGVAGLRAPATGPDIHDRQLDLIITAAAAPVAVALIVLELTRPVGALGVLALPATVVAVLATVVGTRRLWQVRALPVLLALAWPAPWAAAVAATGDAPLLHGLLGSALVGVALALAVRTASARRPAARRAPVIALSAPPVPLRESA